MPEGHWGFLGRGFLGDQKKIILGVLGVLSAAGG